MAAKAIAAAAVTSTRSESSPCGLSHEPWPVHRPQQSHSAADGRRARRAPRGAHLDSHIAKLVAERIANVATHNTSHSIGMPHVAAAIRTSFAHAHARATGPLMLLSTEAGHDNCL